MTPTPVWSPEHASGTSYLNALDHSVDAVAPALFASRDLSPNGRANFAKFCRTIGEGLGPTEDATPHGDSVIGVNGFDLEHVRPNHLRGYLWISDTSKLIDTAKLVVVVRGASKGRFEPDRTPTNVGVVFPAEQYTQIANAKDPFEVRSQLTADQERVRKELKDAPVTRSPQIDTEATFNNELKKLNSLENELLDEIELMKQVLKYTQDGWKAHKNRSAIEDIRRDADNVFRSLVGAALLNSGLRPEQKTAAQRARVSELYRIGSNKDVATRWRNMAILAIDHAHAKQGKVMQAREACYEVLSRS